MASCSDIFPEDVPVAPGPPQINFPTPNVGVNVSVTPDGQASVTPEGQATAESARRHTGLPWWAWLTIGIAFTYAALKE